MFPWDWGRVPKPWYSLWSLPSQNHSPICGQRCPRLGYFDRRFGRFRPRFVWRPETKRDADRQGSTMDWRGTDGGRGGWELTPPPLSSVSEVERLIDRHVRLPRERFDAAHYDEYWLKRSDSSLGTLLVAQYSSHRAAATAACGLIDRQLFFALRVSSQLSELRVVVRCVRSFVCWQSSGRTVGKHSVFAVPCYLLSSSVIAGWNGTNDL